MGTRVASNFANVYMGRLEDKFVYQTQLANWLIMWVRFIDDIFLFWKGDKDSLIDFLDYLNDVVPSIKFTHEISTDSVNFLDTTVLKDGQGYSNTDVYQKRTDTHPYLHWTSAHPPHLKHSIPYSQALRLRRICSSTDTKETDNRIFWFFRSMRLWTRQSTKWNAESSNTNSRGVFTDQRTATHGPDPSCHYIQSARNIHCRSCKT